eukprot:1161212-Pelagomonas_calceolata.AAC.17
MDKQTLRWSKEGSCAMLRAAQDNMPCPDVANYVELESVARKRKGSPLPELQARGWMLRPLCSASQQVTRNAPTSP